MSAPASSKQSPTLTTLWDYLLDPAGVAVAHAQVEVTLDYSLCTMSSPAVLLEPVKKIATSDSNGQWAVDLVPNANLTPTGTVYTVRTPYRSFQVTVPTSSPAQASANLVNVPVLPGQTSALSGNLTVAGTSTLTGAATFSGGATVNGHLLGTGSTPTLGALQTGIASQSISGTDTRVQVTVTTTGSPPASGAILAAVTFATTYAATPCIAASVVNQIVATPMIFVSASGFNFYAGANLAPSTTYILSAIVVG